MNRRKGKPLFPASLAANGKQGLGAGNGQATSETQHTSPAEVAALCLLLHTCLASAQRIVARMAACADWAPPGLIEAADLIDQAADLVATVIASGGAQ